MVKRALSIIFALILIISPVFAAKESIEDNANILTLDQINRLNKQIDEIASNYNQPVYIYTSNEAINNPRKKADELLYQRVGKDGSGLLFYLNMETRDYYFSLSGEMLYILTDQRQAFLEDNFLSDLVSGDYYQAFNQFINDASHYISEGPLEDVTIKKAKSLSIMDVTLSAMTGLATFILSFYQLNKSSQEKMGRMHFMLSENTTANLSNPKDRLVNKYTNYRIIPRPVVRHSGSSSSTSSTTSTHRGKGGGSFSGRGGKF